MVKLAIYVVTGRMPARMNVLLAEAVIPYDIIAFPEEINAEFESAGGEVHHQYERRRQPVTRNDKWSPIYGEPILNADDAKNGIVIKRGQGTGFSGIENMLFYLDITRMLYGDGQAAVAQVIRSVKAA